MDSNRRTTDPSNKRLCVEPIQEMQMDIEDIDMDIVPKIGIPEPEFPYKELPRGNDQDWAYSMRRTMQEIIPGLFLGPYSVASKDKLPDLKAHGITHIICVRHVREHGVIHVNFPNDIVYLVLDMGDDIQTMLIPYLRETNKFIEGALNAGGRVLVHGNAGISRSPAIVIAYIMTVYGVSYDRALRYLQTKRHSVGPSEWFSLQLKEYEVLYQAVHNTPATTKPFLDGLEDPPPSLPLKRILEEDDDDDFHY